MNIILAFVLVIATVEILSVFFAIRNGERPLVVFLDAAAMLPFLVVLAFGAASGAIIGLSLWGLVTCFRRREKTVEGRAHEMNALWTSGLLVAVGVANVFFGNATATLTSSISEAQRVVARTVAVNQTSLEERAQLRGEARLLHDLYSNQWHFRVMEVVLRCASRGAIQANQRRQEFEQSLMFGRLASSLFFAGEVLNEYDQPHPCVLYSGAPDGYMRWLQEKAAKIDHDYPALTVKLPPFKEQSTVHLFCWGPNPR